MNVVEHTIKHISFASWVWIEQTNIAANNISPLRRPPGRKFDILQPLRQWLDNMEVRDRKLAHSLCQLIPAQCPFERDVKLFGKTLFHIPPMCKLNPLYEEVVSLRFRALCYLADECGEDVTPYC
ncbi:MAG: Mo-dependent nitrogenase C-terminal domain-containing protein [Nostocaceae cyanobacterium]|nr:Mo-dependent nitrogenase C-terminal domain-containing protein [Nostocaceae cyanobacterium]